MRRPAWSLILPLAATAFLACGGDDAASAPDVGMPDAGLSDVDAGGEPDAGFPDAGGGPICEVDSSAEVTRDPDCPASALWYRFVEGRAQSGGSPLADVQPQICVESPDGRAACLPPDPTCDDGRWVKEMPTSFRCLSKMVMRMQKLTGGSFATTYCDMAPSGEGILTIDEPYELYPVDPAPGLPPAGDLDAERTIDLQEGVRLTLTPSDLEFCFSADCRVYENLGVRRIGASEATPCFIDPANPPDALFAFTADVDVLDDGAVAVRLDNTDGLAPESVVDLWIQAPQFCTLPTPLADGRTELEEGEWVQYGTATVSGDGRFIEGGTLPCLNWFGYRAR